MRMPRPDIALLNNAEHWHERAASMLKLAANETGELREIMLRCAADYQKLAARAEQRREDLTRQISSEG